MNSHSSISPEEIQLAKTIWDYHRMNHKLQPADLILVLGSHDTRVAERGADLLLQNFAPYIMFSGGLGIITKNLWNEPEAVKFAKIAQEKGVSPEKIITEDKSTNTGENIKFCYQILKERNLLPKSIIIVQKPYMERRAYATFMKQWPGDKIEIMLASPQLSFDDYVGYEFPTKKIIDIMVGDLQRIKEYPVKGFQIVQDIPPPVWKAYEKLVELGYTSHLIKDK